MSHPEIERIRNDMARCKQRIAEMEAGTRGVRDGPWQATDGESGAGRAYGNQLLAQSAALQRFELEYVNAMIPAWTPAAIIERMTSGPRIETRTETITVTRPPDDADVIAKLREFLTKVPDMATVQSLKELIA